MNAVGGYEKEHEQPRWEEFLDEVTLGERPFDNEKEKQLARNAVALMTYHSCKGLEFPQVYMVGMEEGILPHSRSITTGGDSIDEERRLCYVGITRAQERLTFSMTLTRMKWGKERETIPSRFLWEVTGQADSPKALAALRRVADEFGLTGRPRKASQTKSAPDKRPKKT